MTAEICAPALGAADGEVPEGATVVVGEAPDTWVVFGVGAKPRLIVCEHPAISNIPATNAAIRIPSG